LQQYAIAVSIFSLFYNTAEGSVSIIFGAESSSRALVFYGLQSAVEVISDVLVTWRFLSVLKPGNELDDLSKTSPKIVRIERIATIIIGSLLVALTIAAIATSATSLAAHEHPSTTLPAILIAATSTGFTLLLYFIKRYLARALDSSVLNGEALCALCCTQLSVVLLLGSLIYRVWKGGWWVDSATAIVIGLMFGWEGFKMVRWARNKEFDGGCCAHCHSEDTAAPGSKTPSAEAEAEKPEEPEQKRCLCSSSKCYACSTKEESVHKEQV
jgi:divalent metal cation (Fe/Co/Zn/Cd) transporter